MSIVLPPFMPALWEWWLSRQDAPQRVHAAWETRDFVAGDHPEPGDYDRAAVMAGVPAYWLKAICHLETIERATFSGQPVIRMRRGWWKAFAGVKAGAINRFHPLNPIDHDRRWQVFSWLREVDPDAAVRSTLFGMAQIPGAYHDLCGFEQADLFLKGMQAGPAVQLVALGRYIGHPTNVRLQAAMLRDDFEEVALHWFWGGPMRWRVRRRLKQAVGRFRDVEVV